jgi:hypothetical protein
MKIRVGRPRRHPLAALALLLALCCVLSGCVHLQRSVTLDNDGTGTYRFAFGFSDQLINLAGSTFTTQMKTCGALVETTGGSYATADAGGYSTWTFTWRFASLSRLNALLSANAGFCTLSNTNIPTTATADDAFAVAAHARFVTTTYVLTGHLSFTLASPTAGQDPKTAALLQQAYSSFSITMPNWLTSQTAGGSVNGTTVTYTAHNGDTIDFQVVGEGVNTSALLVIGGGGALFIALLFLVARLLHQRREQEEDERAAAEVAMAPAGYLD